MFLMVPFGQVPARVWGLVCSHETQTLLDPCTLIRFFFFPSDLPQYFVSQIWWKLMANIIRKGLPSGVVVKNPSTNVGDAGLIPESGRSPGGGHGNPLQYSCLKNPMDRGACWVTVHRIAKSQIGLKRLSTHPQQMNAVGSCLRDQGSSPPFPAAELAANGCCLPFGRIACVPSPVPMHPTA